MTIRNSLILILVSVSLLSGCGPVKLKKTDTYTISNYQGKLGHSKTKTQLSLLVTTPVANPGYQTENMIYMMTPFQLQSFSSHRWVAPPANMLLPILTQALRNTRYFYAIVSPPFSGQIDYRLDTKILALQQEFLLPKSRVRLIVQATLINNRNNRVAATQIFKVVIPCHQNNPYSGVLATTKAANRIARSVAAFARRHAV